MSKLIGSVILDVAGLHLTAEEEKLLLHPQVGGVIFFRHNYESPEQIKALVKQIRSLRANLLLCVDQEGGRVQRFKTGLTLLPAPGTFHEQDNPIQWSEHMGELMASEILNLGLDLSFAPVLDLNRGLNSVIGDRAFGSNPAEIIPLASAYIAGMNKKGMQATGKHFPGHGGVSQDSHLALPIDNRDVKAIEEDLTVFRTLAPSLGGIMPAHIVFPQVDSLPVCFSAHWLQTVLRQECGFEGAIISDDLSMGGATGMGTYPERANKALNAGCDFVLICNNRTGAKEALEAIEVKQDATVQARRLSLFAHAPKPVVASL